MLRLTKIYAGPLHNREKAFALAKNARALAPDDVEASFLVAQLAYETGNYVWAYDLLRDLVRRRTNDPAVLHSLGRAAYALGKTEEAQRAMHKVLEAGSPSAHAEEAKTFLAMAALSDAPEIPATAETDVQNVLKAHPDYVPGLMADAALKAQQGRRSDAAKVYEKVLRLFPEFAPAKKFLAGLYLGDSSRLNEAFALATSARKALPNDPEVSRLLGKISYQRKDYNAAILLLQESGSERPLDSEGLYYLGMAHVAAGHQAQGLEILQRALAAGLPGSVSVHARQTIEELKKGD